MSSGFLRDLDGPVGGGPDPGDGPDGIVFRDRPDDPGVDIDGGQIASGRGVAQDEDFFLLGGHFVQSLPEIFLEGFLGDRGTGLFHRR